MPDKQEAEYLPQGEEERELAALRARQGVMLGRMRYVLVISVVLVLMMFALIWFSEV